MIFHVPNITMLNKSAFSAKNSGSPCLACLLLLFLLFVVVLVVVVVVGGGGWFSLFSKRNISETQSLAQRLIWVQTVYEGHPIKNKTFYNAVN